MFGKLFKYDTKALARLGVPMLIGVGLLGVLIGGSIFGLSYQIYTPWGNWSGLLLLLVLFLSVFAIAVACAAYQILIYYRYFQSTATDEAYLTFTLPVKPSALIWSKFLSAAVWMLLLGVAIAFVVLLALAGLLLGGMVFGKIPFPELLANFRLFFETFVAELSDLFSLTLPGALFDGETALQWVLYLLPVFLSPFEHILIGYAIVTLASSLARKNKLLVVILFFFLYRFVLGLLSGGAQIVVFGIVVGDGMEFAAGTANAVLQAVKAIGGILLAVGAFLLIRHRFRHNLNLE